MAKRHGQQRRLGGRLMILYNADTTQLVLINGSLAHYAACFPVQPLAHGVMLCGGGGTPAP
jgi:hypothetical protein